MSPGRRLAVTIVLGTALALVGGADVACNKKPDISFSLRVPSAVLDQVAWYEIGAFADGKCPSAEQFAGGVPTYGAAARVVFAKERAQNAPGLGDLPRKTYAFAAAVKAQDCGVLAVGCATADVSSTNDVSITLHPLDPPTGACANGTVCQDAQCVPSTDNSDPSVGANCSLELLGAGPLANPLGVSATIMSDPAIVPTSNGGFLVGYREFDSLGGQARLTFVAIDAGGGIQGVQQTTLPDRCAGVEEDDALGMAFSGNDGLAIVARQPCNGKAGFDFYAIDQGGNVTKSGAETSGQLATSRLALSPAHALAVAPGGGSFFLAAVKDDQAVLNATADVHFATTPPAPFPPGAPSPTSSGAWVATSDKVIALVAAGTGTTGSPPPPSDAGARDAGKDGGGNGGTDGGGGDAGGPEPVLRVSTLAAGADLTKIPAPYEFAGSWAAVSAQGTRVAVASSGTTPGKPVAFRLFDLGTITPKVVDGFAVDALGTVAYADVALNAQGRMFFAVEQPSSSGSPVGTISVVAYDGAASATPTFLRAVNLEQNPRVPSLLDVHDGRIAVAASDTRVGVVWTTARQLTANDPTGAYAVFACR